MGWPLETANARRTATLQRPQRGPDAIRRKRSLTESERARSLTESERAVTVCPGEVRTQPLESYCCSLPLGLSLSLGCLGILVQEGEVIVFSSLPSS